ncbi:unnamed protein product [Taenia asiatica]|uniref:Transcription factor SOX-6 n=1 Tax=Taenia asiatica TaxID=60517 RepID=A0A0R3WCC8_TAEAS|nr:unnamed protein product [Taenia asiatica]
MVFPLGAQPPDMLEKLQYPLHSLPSASRTKLSGGANTSQSQGTTELTMLPSHLLINLLSTGGEQMDDRTDLTHTHTKPKATTVSLKGYIQQREAPTQAIRMMKFPHHFPGTANIKTGDI